MKVRRWWSRAGRVAVAAVVLGRTPVSAQDIEAVSGLTGIPLPAAYHETVRSDPTAFTFERALFARGAPQRSGVTGGVAIPVVLALFSDSDDPHVTREMVQAALFDGPAQHGTLTEAYLEMSRGALHVTGEVLDWVRTSHPLSAAVGTSNGLGGDALAGLYFAEALDSVDGSIDFSVFDNDGPDGVADSGDDDGFVDVITFEYLEVAASCGGPAIWPHRWRMSAWNGSAYVTDDIGASGQPIRIQDYITQGVTDCDGIGVQSASTMAHEFGHALGLSDYYHWIDRSAGPRGRRWVLGCWSLMAAGSWGCGPVQEPPAPFGPTHLIAPSKVALGWAEYLDPGEVWNEEVVLDPVGDGGVALRVPLDLDGTEFLIGEYRVRSGFDAALPAEGVLFYRQVTGASRAPDPSNGAPYYLTLLEQDGNEGLTRTWFEGGNRGEAGDAWGVAGMTSPLHGETSPALRLSDGSASSVTVHEVAVANGSARIVLSTSPTPRLIAPGGPVEVAQVVTFLEAIRVAGGKMPYEALGSVPAGLEVTVVGDDLAVTGSMTDPGPVDLFLWVRDGDGRTSDPVVIALSAPVEWALPLDGLLRPFLDDGGAPPAEEELLYLDDRGNHNGAYDVGDLRSWLRRQGPGI